MYQLTFSKTEIIVSRSEEEKQKQQMLVMRASLQMFPVQSFINTSRF